MTFLRVWVGYAVFGVTAFSAFFVWAVRARQFSNLDRGRYIPLEREGSESEDRQPAKVDRYTGMAIAVISAGLIGIGLWMGFRSG
jgi:hypothetical protein